MPYQPTSWGTGDPISADELSKMDNNDYELYTSYKERGAGIVAIKNMVPTDAANKRTTVSTEAYVNLISLNFIAYPDRYYLVEGRLSRTDAVTIASGSYVFWSIWVNNSRKVWVRGMNRTTTAIAGNNHHGIYVPYMWQSPATLNVDGETTNFTLKGNANDSTQSYYVYSDTAGSGVFGLSSLYVTDLGQITRMNILND